MVNHDHQGASYDDVISMRDDLYYAFSGFFDVMTVFVAVSNHDIIRVSEFQLPLCISHTNTQMPG